MITPETLSPRATGSDKEIGWRLDVKWLEKLRDDVEKATGYNVTLECVEEIVLRTEAICSSQPAIWGPK